MSLCFLIILVIQMNTKNGIVWDFDLVSMHKENTQSFKNVLL